MLLVIGSYSKADAPGIHIYQLDDLAQSFSLLDTIKGVENPSYLTLGNGTDLIYAVTENKSDSASGLHIFEASKGAASHMVSIPFTGGGSCYVSTDPGERHAFVANYGEGTLTVLRLPARGLPGGLAQELTFKGHGLDPERQDNPHIHAALLSPDGKRLLCADLGTDRLYSYNYDGDARIPLEATDPPVILLPPGSGPRQLAFSPDGRSLYVITELSAELFVFAADDLGGGWLQRLPLTQDGYSGKLEGGDIQIDASGRFLYASNRGNANEIIVFEIDPVSGLLDFRQRIGAAGLSPRNILINRQLSLLLVANEQSDNVSIFRINADGTLEFSRDYLQVPSPTCLKMYYESE